MVSVLTLQEYDHQRVVKILLVTSQQLLTMQEDHNTRLRSADGSEKWVTEQLVDDKLMESVGKLWESLSSRSSLLAAGIYVGTSGCDNLASLTNTLF